LRAKGGNPELTLTGLRRRCAPRNDISEGRNEWLEHQNSAAH
jgi:hypothetical protein